MYYVLPCYSFLPFIVVGVVKIASLFKTKSLGLNDGSRKAIRAFSLFLVAIISMSMIPYPNAVFMKQKDTTLGKMANIISEKEDATLITYGELDYGLYTLTGIVPNCKYFCGLNVQNDALVKAQANYVRRGKTDFVVTGYATDSIPSQYPKYRIIATGVKDMNGGNYVLYATPKALRQMKNSYSFFPVKGGATSNNSIDEGWFCSDFYQGGYRYGGSFDVSELKSSSRYIDSDNYEYRRLAYNIPVFADSGEYDITFNYKYEGKKTNIGYVNVAYNDNGNVITTEPSQLSADGKSITVHLSVPLGGYKDAITQLFTCADDVTLYSVDITRTE